MPEGVHISIINICPKLFDVCESLKGSRVRIIYKTGQIFEGYIRRVSKVNNIIFSDSTHGIIKMPIEYIDKIEFH